MRPAAKTTSTHRPRPPFRFGRHRHTQPETSQHREIPASAELAKNAERMVWAAHQRAAELVDAEPGPVSQTIFAAVHAEWRRAFLDLPS